MECRLPSRAALASSDSHSIVNWGIFRAREVPTLCLNSSSQPFIVRSIEICKTLQIFDINTPTAYTVYI